MESIQKLFEDVFNNLITAAATIANSVANYTYIFAKRSKFFEAVLIIYFSLHFIAYNISNTKILINWPKLATLTD